MRNIVLFAANCSACSRAARLVTEASIPGLEALPFEDPHVSQALASAGKQTPDRPALLVIGETEVHLLTGLAMRRRLAALIGWRRSGTVVRLLAAEWRARLARHVVIPGTPSRRGVIGGTLAGIIGWAMSSGLAHAAAKPADDGPALKVASEADSERVLKTATARQAIAAFGRADTHVLEVTGGSNPVFVLVHPERRIYTCIDKSALRVSDPVGISLGAAPTPAGGLRYYTVRGTGLADLITENGRVRAQAVDAGTAHPGTVEPDINKTQIACFIACVGVKSSASCIQACIGCATDVVGTIPQIVACTQCVVCAGPNGVSCLRDCNII
jgi:hypothetical protein